MTGEQLIRTYQRLLVELGHEEIPSDLLGRFHAFQVELETSLRAEEVIDVR